VSRFKKNYDHLTKEMFFGNYKEATRATRVQGHLHSNGAHRWHNYMKSPDPPKGILRGSFDSMLVLMEMEVIKFEGSPQVNLISLKWKWIVKSFSTI
ncbi:hypothetical protein H5410_031179, partial [Solanum commersonii]